jgi:hypothetical protein
MKMDSNARVEAGKSVEITLVPRDKWMNNLILTK